MIKYRWYLLIPLVVVAWVALRAAEHEKPSGNQELDAAEAAIEETARMTLRAYYSAPPMIPHPVTTANNAECKVCHAKIMEIGGRVTVPTPHLEMSNCQQCHVGQQQFNAEAPLVMPENSWVGLQEPREGTRAYEQAPPTIPHRLFMRQACNTCHQSEHPNPDLRIDHADRTNCQQCHVADLDHEF